MLKTSLDKFREENKNLVVNLKTQDKHKAILNEKQSELKNLEKINTENVNELFEGI